MSEKVESNRMLVLVDPSQEKQPALRRACINAQLRKDKPTLIVFLAVDRELHDVPGVDPVLYRGPEWFENIRERIEAPGAPYELATSYSNKWAESVIELANEKKVDRIMVPVTVDHEGNHIISDEVWKLLRTSPVPVTLVHPGQSEERNCFLAAVKMQDPEYRELNNKVLKLGRELADIYEAELHVVNVYSDSAEYPDRSQIIRAAGNIPNDHVHVIAGDSADVIRKVADDVNADLLLIGTKRRTGFAATLRGNTISKILRHQERDVMSVV